MKSFNLLLVAVLLGLFCSCDPANNSNQQAGTMTDSNTRVLSSDLYPNCWFNEHTLQKQVVHSKPFASKTDSVWSDSYGFRGYFGDLGDKIPKFVVIDFWTLFTRTALKADLFVSIDSIGKSKLWTGANLIDSVKTANQWQNIHCQFTLPQNLLPSDQITIYVSNHEKKNIYVDDFVIKFLY
jgi:hypothetical protein